MLFEAPITMRATSTGAGSTLSGIGRLVAAAQAREAPVQRLADTIAGRFCYTVMGASAATFAFWTLAGGPPVSNLPDMLHVLIHGLLGLCTSLMVSARLFEKQAEWVPRLSAGVGAASS